MFRILNGYPFKGQLIPGDNKLFPCERTFICILTSRDTVASKIEHRSYDSHYIGIIWIKYKKYFR